MAKFLGFLFGSIMLLAVIQRKVTLNSRFGFRNCSIQENYRNR